MTIKHRIVTFLRDHPEGVDDDDLARALDLSARQQANSRCRELEKDGLVERRPINGKIHNFWIGRAVTVALTRPREIKQTQPKFDDWFWEGNVQSTVVNFLVSQSFSITSVADTATHQQGIDIIAQKNGVGLWVSVKGYPRGTDRTNPSVQAGHWFKDAVFDMVAYRERDKGVLLALAFPDYPRYRNLAAKITWFQPVAKFSYFWVRETGEVSISSSPAQVSNQTIT